MNRASSLRRYTPFALANPSPDTFDPSDMMMRSTAWPSPDAHELERISLPRPESLSAPLIERGRDDVEMRQRHERPMRWKTVAIALIGVVTVVVGGTILLVSYVTCEH